MSSLFRSKRFVMFVLTSVMFGLAGAIGVYGNQVWQMLNTEQSRAATISARGETMASTRDLEGLNPASAATEEPASAEPQPESTDPATESSSGTTPPPPIPAGRPSGDDCGINLDKLTDAYDRDIKQAKKMFESTLAYPTVGSMIRSRYIDEYNAKVSGIFDHYRNVAEQSACSLPIDRPAPMPAP